MYLHIAVVNTFPKHEYYTHVAHKHHVTHEHYTHDAHEHHNHCAPEYYAHVVHKHQYVAHEHYS